MSVRLSQRTMIISPWNTCMSQFEINRVALCIKKCLVRFLARFIRNTVSPPQLYGHPLNTDTTLERTVCFFNKSPALLALPSTESVQLQASFGRSKSTTFLLV